VPDRVELNPDWPWAKDYRIAQGVKVGNTVYVSGQVGFDKEGNVVGGDDMKAQSVQTFENIKAVLTEAGATMDDVVKITAYITDMDRYAEYAEARGEAFPRNLPASATVATPILVNPNLLVEVEAIAEIGCATI
jgi:2-iminobutanoate/2-iminopropanoate deaminase